MMFIVILGMGGASTISYIQGKGALEKASSEQITQLAESTFAVSASWIGDRKLDFANWSRQ